MERKLSTIFASDVVGFSKMMGNDEEKTLQILGERREVIDSVIAEYQGIIFGSAGDSVIAEFASPVKATECAVHIQDKMKILNKNSFTMMDSLALILRNTLGSISFLSANS